MSCPTCNGPGTRGCTGGREQRSASAKPSVDLRTLVFQLDIAIIKSDWAMVENVKWDLLDHLEQRTSEAPLEKAFGKWPGDETDAELAAGLRAADAKPDDFKCLADDCDKRVAYVGNYCSAECKYPDYEAKYWALWQSRTEAQNSPQEPREGRPDKTDVGNGIGSSGRAGQPGASEVGTAVEAPTDEAAVPANLRRNEAPPTGEEMQRSVEAIGLRIAAQLIFDMSEFWQRKPDGLAALSDVRRAILARAGRDPDEQGSATGVAQAESLRRPDTSPELEQPTAAELSRRGGEWLGAAREWLQWNTRNGDRVTWGSGDLIEPQLSVRQIEDLAAEVAAAAMRPQPAEETLARALKARWKAEAEAADLRRAAARPEAE